MPIKTVKPAHTITDVIKPSAQATARPIIVGNRPILKDPMMTAAPDTATPSKSSATTDLSAKLTPPAPVAQPETMLTPEVAAPPDLVRDAENREARRSEVKKLIDSKQYFVPVNAMQRRRSRRVSALGVLLIILLGLALFDLLLDSGAVHISGLQPLTHFFGS